MKIRTILPAGLAAILAYTNQAEAHSWVEKLMRIASNGTFIGPAGYPRGFVPRTSLAFSDAVSENHIPPNGRSTGTEILPTDLMCKPSQSIGSQTLGSPALVAAPGDNIALIYEENGHVTLLDRSPTKPVGSGTIYIYGTKNPSNSDTYLGIHRVWNTAGTGGDKRGKLLATRPFDDGQCYQNNTSPLAEARRDKLGTVGNDLNCQADLQLPEDAGTSGTYTLYWLWEWPTLNTVTGQPITNESYTTCMDIVMSPNKLPNAGSFNSKQLVDSRAIEAEMSTAFLVNPTIAEQLTATPGVPARPTPSAISPGFAPLHAPPNGAGAIVYVTVTAKPEENTVTVTHTVYSDSSPSEQAQPSATQSPITRAQPSTTGSVPSKPSSPPQNTATTTSAPSQSLPAVQPFLNAASAVAVPESPPAILAAPVQTSTAATGACAKPTAESRRRRRSRQ